MNQESTEVVLRHCLEVQHENTKNAIYREVGLRMVNRIGVGDTAEMRQLQQLMQWINELKLEDTK